MEEKATKRKTLWMRYVDFEKVKDLLHLIHENNGKLRAGELEQLGIEEGVLVKGNGQPLGRYRGYNYRKVMENLGLAEAKKRLYYTSVGKKASEFLELTDFKKLMPAEAKEILRAIIVENDDCKEHFFNAFMETSFYTLEDLRREGKSIYAETKGMQISSKEKGQIILLRNPMGNVIKLTTPDEINAVYWGVRPWAMDLEITDEIMTSFSDGRIIYPINPNSSEEALNEVLLRKMTANKDGSKWSLIHIPEFIKESALSTRLPTDRIKEFFLQLKAKYPRLVMFVPSSTAFIDIRTPFERQDSAIRNSYLYIKGKGYISHLRTHENIREEMSI